MTRTWWIGSNGRCLNCGSGSSRCSTKLQRNFPVRKTCSNAKNGGVPRSDSSAKDPAKLSGQPYRQPWLVGWPRKLSGLFKTFRIPRKRVRDRYLLEWSLRAYAPRTLIYFASPQKNRDAQLVIL